MSPYSTAELNHISIQINRYFSLVLLLFGMTGNILNCLIFSQRKLRSNPCVLYFLAASILNLISILSGVPPRMLRDWNILPDLSETNSRLCQFRLFVLFSSRTIAAWLLLCATIDRYLVSSTKIYLRRMSNIKQAIRWIFIFTCIFILFWSETFYCFDANLVNTPLKCYAKSNICRRLNDLAQAFITTIIPSFIMLIFGLNTITNIHRSQLINRISFGKSHLAMTTTNKYRKIDTSLTRMLFLQIILLTIFNIPQAIQKLYITTTFNQSKSSMERSWERFLFGIAVLLTYMPSCLPFYIYTFTGRIFRQTLFQLCRPRGYWTCENKFLHKNNQVEFILDLLTIQ